MKYPDLNKWKYSSSLEGLLLFAQLVEELLFDYTMDTYKVPAMNSHVLSDELCQTISEVESGAIRPGALKPIKEELCDRLTKDLVAMSILGEVREELISCLNKNDGVAETKVRAELLKNKLDSEYLAENKRLLKATLADVKQKERISSLTRTLITELIYIGYSPEYIYFETINFFFEGRSPSVIDNISLIDDYLAKFSGKESSFVAVFRVNETFGQLKDFAESVKIKIQPDTPSIKLIGRAARAMKFLAENESLPLYLIVNKVETYDVLSAREDGDDSIQLLESLARYHVHRQDFRWSDEAIICDENNRALGVYRKPVAATLKRPEPDISRLSGLIARTFNTMSSGKLKEESFGRISRAFARHDIAVKSETPESQLLELWAAIEVLFTTYEGGDEKILQIARSIVPFETTEYAAKVAADLYLAIRNSGRPEALEVINEIGEGSNEIEKCLALVSIQDNEGKRNKLYEILREHVLLRNRIFYIKNRTGSADLIRKMLVAHDRRVTWQIHRIYRARNLYIHSGQSLRYVKILVENLHAYLDRVLDVLIERIELTGYPVIDIDQVCLDVRLEYDAHLKLLEKAKCDACTRDNYKVLLFGH
jgi:hypothetical protein